MWCKKFCKTGRELMACGIFSYELVSGFNSQNKNKKTYILGGIEYE